MITINGQQKELPGGEMPLPALLLELGFGEKPVVVELNREALSPSEFSSRLVRDGDELEIITIAAGG